MVPGSKLNYVESAGVGAVGGALGGAVIASIENAKVGKIYFPSRPTLASEFSDRLKGLVAGQLPVSEVQAPEAAGRGEWNEPAANTN
jgi:hypothetical protein